MSSSTVFDEKSTYLAMNVMIIGAIIGLLVNLYVIYGVRKTRTFGASFGSLCISQSIANCGNAATFGFLVTTITLVDPTLHETYWGARCGQLLIFFWNGDLFTHVFATFNRLCCILFPAKYSLYFCKRNTSVAIGLIWTVAFLQAVPYFHYDCTLYFDLKSLSFQFRVTPCLPYVALYFDFYLNLVIVSIISLTDLFTLYKIRNMAVDSTLNTEAKKRKRTRDVRFFLQTFSQAAIVVTELVFYFYISNLVENKWAKFFMTTFAWILLQMMDGVIVIAFNKELRRVTLQGGSSVITATSHYSK